MTEYYKSQKYLEYNEVELLQRESEGVSVKSMTFNLLIQKQLIIKKK